jgi:methylmalonic aciduria homocystinuria type C protein
MEIISDYDVVPSTRRAKVVMQTCAHVSGAAFYYDPNKVDSYLVNLDEKQAKKVFSKQNLTIKMQKKIKKYSIFKSLMGVCLHPKYGGWFAMRSVFIFEDLLVENGELKQLKARDPLNNDLDQIVKVIKLFNYYWKDARYRETFQVKARYSNIQQEYFNLEPKYRKNLLKEWLDFNNHKVLCEFYEKHSLDELKKRRYLLKNFYIV